MSALEHFIELRKRFIASLAAFITCFVLALVFYERVISLFTVQFARMENILGARLFANSITEGFLVKLQASAIVALIVTLPFHLVNTSQFVFPALGTRVRRIATIGMIVSFIFALLGAYIAYFRIIPFSIRFLTNAAFIPDAVGVLLNYQKSISYVLAFVLWAIITFQAPLVLEILLALNLLDRRAVFRASRYVIILVFVVAAVVTPSVDPLSQCMIAIPLIALYFLVILVAKIFGLGDGSEEDTEGK